MQRTHLSALLPYPGPLAWPQSSSDVCLVVESFRMFPQFDGVAWLPHDGSSRLAFQLAPCFRGASMRPQVAASTRFVGRRLRLRYMKLGGRTTCDRYICSRLPNANLVTTSPSSRWEGLTRFPTAGGGEPPSAVSPDASPAHPIGRSDGRCVQRAGT